jgi:NAD(P)-dependent dehydrogenase (short-subunit alcohol dehydrogenase family)
MQIRLNPVSLVVGAGSGVGAACALELARKSQGGLLLADADEAALTAAADDIEAAGVAPERLSTLAFDPAQAGRWDQAIAFIQSQYGRLDWAVVNTGAAQPKTDLVDWRGGRPLESAIHSLRAIMELMSKNAQGGAILVTGDAAAIKPPADARAAPGLLELIRAAAHEGEQRKVRINAIAAGGPETPMWSQAPVLEDLVRDGGGEAAAFARMQGAPYARCSGDIKRLIALLLTDDAPVTGATLVVDGGYTL